MSRILEGRNRANGEEAASFVDKYEDLEREKLREKMSYMERCRRITEQQKELLDDAKSKGIAKKVVRNVAKARELEAKVKDLLDDLEDDDKSMFIDIRKALGDYADLPLGVAAVEREDGGQDETTAAIVGAVKDSMTDEEWEKAADVGDDDDIDDEDAA
jgi:hypothetical protein